MLNFEIAIDEGRRCTVALSRTTSGATVWIDGSPHQATLRQIGRAFEVSLDDRVERIWLVVHRDTVYAHAFGSTHRLQIEDPTDRALEGGDRADVTTAPMPGMVFSVAVAAGQDVEAGEVLLVIESMKMQSEIVAPRAGTVGAVHVEPGDSFDRGAPLATLSPLEEES